jgi:hypothetical protein
LFCRGNRLGFGLQPMLHVASLRAALIEIDSVCLPRHLVVRRRGVFLWVIGMRWLGWPARVDGALALEEVFLFHALRIGPEHARRYGVLTL